MAFASSAYGSLYVEIREGLPQVLRASSYESAKRGGPVYKQGESYG